MTQIWRNSTASRTTHYNTLCLSLLLGLATVFPAVAQAQDESASSSRYAEENKQIRRDKFDLIVPKIMRERGIDMWIHVMREPIVDPFGEDLGSSSGVIIFTDRGSDRVERAIIGRRWQTSVYEVKRSEYVDPIPGLGAYDIIGEPVLVIQPLSSPMTEYNYRFNGLREFVEARKPERIAVNFREHLVPWATFAKTDDGISHVDFRLLTKELGETYADRLVSSEYLIMDYNVSPVPSEVALLKKMRGDHLEAVDKEFAAIKPGVTKTGDLVTVSVIRPVQDEQYGWDDAVVQGGDILAAPTEGRFAYVLRDGETEPSTDVQKLWAQKLMIDKILKEIIRPGLTGREIMTSYKQKLADVGIIVIDPRLTRPQTNLFEGLCFLKPTLGVWQFDFGWEACWDEGTNIYPGDFDSEHTQVVFDMHGFGKGARETRFDHGLGPRMGSYGPDWTRDLPLALNHHFVLEYFFYMPSPTDEGEYLVFWNHEDVIATENGVEHLSTPQKELLLIR